MILFCLPYAGGSEGIYHKWKRYLDTSISLEPIELKGRGRRFNERYYENLEDAVDDIFENMRYKIINDEYAIYGHSMGSLLAYELYYKIHYENVIEPKHIFFSGYKPPSIPRVEKQIHLLPDIEFLDEVIKLGGTPQELIENKELNQLYIPILRSDFKMIEKYIYRVRNEKIQCDITILNGKEDEITLEEILSWKKHGDKGFKVYNFDGDHFYINNNIENIINVINHTLVIKKVKIS